MQALQHQEHSALSCFYPQERWNAYKPSIFLSKTCGNCLPGRREVLEETQPAPGPEPCLAQSAARPRPRKLGSSAGLTGGNSCKSCFFSLSSAEYTALTYFTSYTHQFYSGVSPVTSVGLLHPHIR